MFFKKFIDRVSKILGRDILVSILNFFITTYIATSLGAEGFGFWIGVLTFLMICDLLFRLKLDQLIIYYSNEYPRNIDLYKKITILSSFALFVCAILIIIFNKIIIDFYSFNNFQFLAVIFVTFSMSVFGNIIFYIFLAEAKFHEYNISILLQAIVNGFVVFVLFNIYSPSILIPLISVMTSWAAVIIFFKYHRFIQPNVQEIPKQSFDLTSREILSKGSLIYTSSALRALSDQIPRMFAINFLGPATIGYIGLAQIISSLINRVPNAINSVLYPMLVQENDNELKKCLAIIRVVLIIFLPIIIVLELLMQSFIVLFYGIEFVKAATYIQILLPFVYLGLPGLVLSSYFFSQGKFRDLLFINFSAVFISIIGLFIGSFFSLELAPIIALCSVYLSITIASIILLYMQAEHIAISPKINDLLLVKNFFYTILYKNND